MVSLHQRHFSCRRLWIVVTLVLCAVIGCSRGGFPRQRKQDGAVQKDIGATPQDGMAESSLDLRRDTPGDGPPDAHPDRGVPDLPPPIAEEQLFTTATALVGVSNGRGLAIGWGDFGSPTDPLRPDGVFDLVVASVLQPSQVYLRRSHGFSEADYQASDLQGVLTSPRHSVSLGGFRPDGRAASLAMAGNVFPWPDPLAELVLMWHEPTRTYLDLTSDAVVTTDNAILAGSVTSPSQVDQSSYDFNIAFIDYDSDGDLDLYRLHGSTAPYVTTDPSRLLTNVGSTGGVWTFAANGSGEPAAAHLGSEARGLAIGDIDGDGRPDIMVASQASKLYLNRTRTTDDPNFVVFDETTSGLSFTLADGGLMHGVSLIDHDNDGDHDLAWVPYTATPWMLLKTDVSPTGSLTLSPVALGAAEGRGAMDNKVALYPGDYDNDGDLDLFLASGAKGQGYTNALLRNEHVSAPGAATPFTLVTPGALAMDGSPRTALTYGASWVDLDHDGDLDLVTTGIGAAGGIHVIRNNLYERGSTLRYYRLRVRLRGDAHPIGTRVIVSFGKHHQLQEIFATQGFGCSPYPDLHFGAGLHAEVTVRIYAPGVSLSSPPTKELVGRPTSNQAGHLDIVDIP